MPEADLTSRLADRCASASYEAISDDVLDRIKRLLLDHVGLVVGGHALAESSGPVETGIQWLASGGEATVLATGDGYAPDRAALLNGTYAHSLDFDDTHRASSLHPGAPVIPAALATAERTGASARRFLAGVVTGYDVACTLGRAVNPDAHYDRGFHITATCGTFGATAAAGTVAGLSRAEVATAFGINGSQVAGSLQFLVNGAWNKRLHPGLAAQRAVHAIALARAGFRGAEAPIDGRFGFFHGYTADPDPTVVVEASPGAAVLETGIKPYPCCRYMHPAIDALIDLAPEFDAGDVTRIRVELPAAGVTLTGEPIERKRRPENFVDCQFSMPFAAALAASTGDAGLAAFIDGQDRLDEPAFRRLMARTTVSGADDVQALFPERWAARVVVETSDGTHEQFVETARGEPERPLDWARVEGKFSTLTDAAGWSDPGRESVASIVRTLEERDVTDLVTAVDRSASDARPAAP